MKSLAENIGNVCSWLQFPSDLYSINNPPLYRHEDDVGVGNVPEATPKRTDTQSNLFHLELY